MTTAERVTATLPWYSTQTITGAYVDLRCIGSRDGKPCTQLLARVSVSSGFREIEIKCRTCGAVVVFR